jgi:S1-C subfamily serine protease
MKHLVPFSLGYHLIRWVMPMLMVVLLGTQLWVLPAQAQSQNQSQSAASTQSDPPPVALTQSPVVQLSSESFVAAAVRRVGPAVVRIDTEKTVVRNVPDFFYDEPLFRGFFGPDAYGQMPRQEEHLRGQGSGFIIDGSGYILTNAHVVNQADQVTVTLKDGRTFEGTVEGADEVTDLAIVKVDAGRETLPVATLGDSEKVEVGDWAIAVGNPLGLDNTVTLGIVSTLKRSSATVGIPNKRLDFIQTDAAINPGNSGGPLLNSQGEVIGINTAIRADAMGIGFAIPINKAKEIKDQLARGERIAHPYLGVQIATLTPDLAKRNNEDPNAGIRIPEIAGVLVMRVMPDTPAAEGGLRRGDVITAIDGNAVKTAEQLQSQIDKASIGQNLRVSIQRGSATKQLAIKAAELNGEQE